MSARRGLALLTLVGGGVQHQWPRSRVAAWRHPPSTRRAGSPPAPPPLQSYVPLPKYFVSEWSFAQFKLAPQAGAGAAAGANGQPQPGDDGRCIVGFVPTAPHTLVIVTQGGSYYKVGFDALKGGQCIQQAYGTYGRD